jgi:hypothetical protein
MTLIQQKNDYYCEILNYKEFKEAVPESQWEIDSSG